MEKKIKILALFGKSASGKDTIQNWIIKSFPQLTNKIVSCTTRPPREGEQEGVDYFFLSDEQFAEKVLNGSMLEATSFREWFYGTSLDQLDKNKINIGVFNVAGIECILEDSRLEVIPVWVYASGKTRLFRSLQRESDPDCAEICRRYMADDNDFNDIDFEYIGWINEDNERHKSWKYRKEQIKRILEDNHWADLDKI